MNSDKRKNVLTDTKRVHIDPYVQSAIQRTTDANGYDRPGCAPSDQG